MLRLAHSKTIDDSDFYQLENAIAYSQSVNRDTTNRYYVDIESEENVVLPMDNMSQYANLVQTRVGEDIVYNTPYSYDFGENAIDPVSDKQADIGRTFTWTSAYKNNENSSETSSVYSNYRGDLYASDEFVKAVVYCLYCGYYYNNNTGTLVNGDGIGNVEIDGNTYYYTEWNHLGTDLIDKANVEIYRYDRAYLDGRNETYYTTSVNNDYASGFTISFNDGTDKRELMQKLSDYLNSDDCSDALKRLNQKGYLRYFLRSTNYDYTASYNRTINDDLFSYLENYYGYYWSYYYGTKYAYVFRDGYSIDYIAFDSKDDNGNYRIATDEDRAAYNELVEFLENNGLSPVVSSSYYPNGMPTELTPVKEYLNITETTGSEQAKTWLPFSDKEAMVGKYVFDALIVY